jgi:hypothetical protein
MGVGGYALAVDKTGKPGALWAEMPNDGNPLTLTRYNERGAFEWPAPAQLASGLYRYGEHWLAYAADGSAHALIYETPAMPPQTVLYTGKPAGGAWSPLTPVTTNAHAVTLSADGATPRVAYVTEDVSGQRAVEQRALTAGAWQTVGRWQLGPQEVVETIALEPGGAVALVERMTDAGEAVLYRRSPVAAAAATYSLSQAVTIPANAHAPTLSFFMRASADPGEAFGVAVEAAGKVEPLKLNVSGDAWRHAWADLSKWAGQTVTLRFAVEQAAGRPFTQVALDDVAAGEWLTPVIDAAQIDGQTLTVSGWNFIGAPELWLGDRLLGAVTPVAGKLSAPVPADMKPGQKTVSVVNPGRQVALTAVTVGREVFLPTVR